MRPSASRWLRRLAAGLFIGSAVLATWVVWNARDRNPNYQGHLRLRPSRAAGTLQVGFGRRRITPSLDRPVWLAGFGRGRRATAIHDDLWAVASVIDDGEHRLGLVVLDAIGLYHDQVVAVRRRVSAEAHLDYVIVASTHNHSAPDVMGIWGPHAIRSGVDPVYRDALVTRAAAALDDAVGALAPAQMSLLEIPMPTEGLVADSRPPHVFDATLRVMHFTVPAVGATIGSIVNWANHPETPWAQNTEVTADFPGYLRELLADGVTVEGRSVAPGLGGTHIYVNGAIGGLMTTDPDTAVTDPFENRTFAVPSHEKARAVGRRLGHAVLGAVQARAATNAEATPRLTIAAETLELRLDNVLFRAAAGLGVIERGQPRWNRIRTEVSVIRLGDATMICVPGELYPEIANGGIVHPPGADFDTRPVEVPSLRDLAPGRVTFLFGLANDEIGYIIPKSQWDDHSPWLDGAPERPYGEINSLGPETGPDLHRALVDVMADAADAR